MLGSEAERRVGKKEEEKKYVQNAGGDKERVHRQDKEE